MFPSTAYQDDDTGPVEVPLTTLVVTGVGDVVAKNPPQPPELPPATPAEFAVPPPPPPLATKSDPMEESPPFHPAEVDPADAPAPVVTLYVPAGMVYPMATMAAPAPPPPPTAAEPAPPPPIMNMSTLVGTLNVMKLDPPVNMLYIFVVDVPAGHVMQLVLPPVE